MLLSRGGFVSAPYAILRDPDGRVRSSLNLLSSVHTLGAADETYAVTDDELEVEHGQVSVVVRTSSSAWEEHEPPATRQSAAHPEPSWSDAATSSPLVNAW